MILIGASQLDILFCDKPTLLSKIANYPSLFSDLKKNVFIFWSGRRIFFLIFTDSSVIYSSSDVTEKLVLVF